MNEAIGTKTAYFLTEAKDGGVDQFVVYNEYNGSFGTTTSDREATRFELKQQAVDLSNLRNQMAELMKSGRTFKVIEEVITRAEVVADTTA